LRLLHRLTGTVESKTTIGTILQTIVGEIWLLKTTDLNVKGNKSFSSNYFCSGKFVSMHMMTDHPCIVTIYMKCYLFTVPHNFAHDFIRELVFCSTNSNKKEHWCVLSENAVLFVKYFFQHGNMFGYPFTYDTAKSKQT